MKKYLAVIILACCLTACGSSTGADDNSATPKETTTTTAVTTAEESSEPEDTESEPEETTTTTKVTESEPEETESKAEATTTTTTAPAEEKPAPTYTLNTAWHERETLHSIVNVDTHVYAAPARDAEQIGDLKAGDVVVNIGYSEVTEWIVVEWNNGIGFVSTFDLGGAVEYSDNNYYEEPVQDNATYDNYNDDPVQYDEPVQDEDFYLA